jgi:hypothetical protein
VEISILHIVGHSRARVRVYVECTGKMSFSFLLFRIYGEQQLFACLWQLYTFPVCQRIVVLASDGVLVFAWN